MSPSQRYVLDTNTLISALLLAQSVPARAFEIARADGEILASAATVVELSEVLARPKFDRYVTATERDQFLSLFIRDAVVVQVTEQIKACRDPKDDKFLDLAVAGDASCLVTGDADLLTLHPYRGVSIVTAVQFLQRGLAT